MRRKRIKAAKKAKLAKIKEAQSQINHEDNSQEKNDPKDIDATIKNGLKKINKSIMKKDDRFKDVIGKISKIKRKADANKAKEDNIEAKKKKNVDKKKSVKLI